jgi:hypothetical protein
VLPLAIPYLFRQKSVCYVTTTPYLFRQKSVCYDTTK